MHSLPENITKELDGWTLFLSDWELTGEDDGRLAALRRSVAEAARGRLDIGTLSADPTIAALRRLFKQAGTDPTRYRPSSEALLRRLLKGGELPAISPMVDLSNCLSVELAVPCCVMAYGTFDPPLAWRAGTAGEQYQSLKGPFKLEGRPLLCDAQGPLDTPITGNERVKVTPQTRRSWLVAYLPSAVVPPDRVRDTLERLVDRAPVIGILETSAL
jgi:DNA/RNA-binding domain of Phe-tRNA-synthetase-like protein